VSPAEPAPPLPGDAVLRFKPHLRCQRVGDDRVFLIGERQRFLLEGEIYAQIAEALDGRRTVM
jgi:ribosomal protein S12 methylthiotransferase accessory factor